MNPRFSLLCKTALLAFVCVLTASLIAQEITGDMRGIVTDPSGAVVSGASVVVTNTDRNAVIRDLKTGPDGAYVAAYLPVGHYKVTVTAPGFRTYDVSDIVIDVNDRRTVDVKLRVGAAADTVEVREALAQIDLQSATASGLITGTQVRELPLTSRNYLNLVTLQPGVSNFSASDQSFVGVTNPTGLSAQVNLAVNGNRPTQNNWAIDGADNVDRGANLTLLAFPSIDSIAEFKVLRSNYLPEHGRSSSGEVTLITRGGTDQFHGSAYEFWRNDKLNANNYFNNNSGLARPELRWNDFGFTVGGPIARKKTFFFYSQEWRRIITYSTFRSGELPTARELAGDFSATGEVCTHYDPATASCTTTGTQIGAIDPVALAYVNDIYKKIAPPNNADNSLTWVGRNVFNYREENVRIDHNFSTRFSIFGRYLDDAIPTQEPAGLFTGLGVPGVANTTTNAPGRNLAVHATWTLSQSALADMGYAFSYGAVVSDPTGLIATRNSPDVKPTLPFSGAPRLPDVNFNDGQGLTGFGPYRDFNRNHNAFANFSRSHAHHALKFGASFNYYTKDENVNGWGGANGAFNMSDTVNGPADGTFQQEWANFLTGTVANFTQANLDFRALVHQKQLEVYGQDEWRARPNLTISYGLRYSLFLAPTYGNGLLTTFDPSKFNAAAAPAIDSNGLYAVAPATPYVNGIIIGGKGSPYGGAVQKTSKADIAPRLGVVWDPRGDGKTSIRSGFGLFYDSPSVGTVENFVPTNPPFVSFTSISNTNLSKPASGIADVNLSPATIGGVGPNWKQPYSMMWSLDMQHQFTPTTVFDIGYYGSVGRHLIGILDVNMPQPGAFLSVGIPGPVSAGNTQKLNQVRPYKGWDAINQFETVFNSNYNGLQAQLQKQFTSNAQIVLNYTWSHALGTASNDFRSPQNTYNLRGDYGNIDFDRRHIFNASYVYTVPWHKTQQGFAGHVLGGWEVSGIVYANTGSHLTVTASRDPAGLGVRGNSNSSGRPDLVGDPQQGAPHTIAEWFNKAAFALVPAGQVRPGNERRGTVVGPGYVRWDAALFKNNRISERFSLQFRAEAQNALNHTNFNNPSTSFTSSLFSKITTARDPRNIQLALKLLF
jgi:hypothetical protein